MCNKIIPNCLHAVTWRTLQLHKSTEVAEDM